MRFLPSGFREPNQPGRQDSSVWPLSSSRPEESRREPGFSPPESLKNPAKITNQSKSFFTFHHSLVYFEKKKDQI